MTDEIERALHTLKLPGMASYWTSLEETHQLDRITLRDGMQMMVQTEQDTRRDNAIKKLVKSAHFKQQASIEELEMDTERGISSAMVADLGTGQYIKDGLTIINVGPAGTGKSYLATALGDRACRQGFKVMYFTMNTLVGTLKLSRMENRTTNFMRKLANQDLLIIDDWGMLKLEGEVQNEIEQIIDDRYGYKALIIASQLPVSDWYNIFQSELIAEACLDRLVHKSIRFTLKGDS